MPKKLKLTMLPEVQKRLKVAMDRDFDFLRGASEFLAKPGADEWVEKHEDLHRRHHELHKANPKPVLMNLCNGPRKPKS
jgi:hypothetical protein